MISFIFIGGGLLNNFFIQLLSKLSGYQTLDVDEKFKLFLSEKKTIFNHLGEKKKVISGQGEPHSWKLKILIEWVIVIPY